MSSTMPTVLNDIRFYGLLLKFDQDLAAQVREGGCPVCAAALHSAPVSAQAPRRTCRTGKGVSRAL